MPFIDRWLLCDSRSHFDGPSCGGVHLHISHSGGTTEYSAVDPAAGQALLLLAVVAALLSVASSWADGRLLLQIASAAVAVSAAAGWGAATCSESVMLVPGLGLILRSRRRLRGGDSTFVPAERVRHVIINEGVGASDVTCYLALVVEGADHLTVAFPHLLPRLPLLAVVYRDLQRRLRGGGGGGGGGV